MKSDQPISDRPRHAARQRHPRAAAIRSTSIRLGTAAAGLAMLAAGCSGTSSARTIPAGMQKDGALYASCTLTRTDGVPSGATIKLYNPGSQGVRVTQVGIEEISNGVLLGSSPIQTPDFPGTIAAGSEDTVPISFGGASSATSCKAGWQ